MFQRILVPLDGSKHAEEAIPVAARLARASGGSLVFLKIIFAPIEFENASFASITAWRREYERQVMQAEEYLSSTVTATYAHDLAGIPIEREVASGAVAPTIFATAWYEQIDLIVMCSRGEAGLKRWFFGSVAQEAVQRTPVPVLVFHEQVAEFPAPQADQSLHAFIPLDGSARAEAALKPTAQLIAALAPSAPVVLHLFSVIDAPSSSGKFKAPINVDALLQDELRQEAMDYLQQLERQVPTRLGTELQVQVTSSVVVNPSASRAILEVTERAREPENSFALIAMATHGRTGLAHLAMGSVTERVLDHTRLPLLIVPSHPQKVQAATSKEDREIAPHAEYDGPAIWRFRGKSKTSIPER